MLNSPIYSRSVCQLYVKRTLSLLSKYNQFANSYCWQFRSHVLLKDFRDKHYYRRHESDQYSVYTNARSKSISYGFSGGVLLKNELKEVLICFSLLFLKFKFITISSIFWRLTELPVVTNDFSIADKKGCHWIRKIKTPRFLCEIRYYICMLRNK